MISDFRAGSPPVFDALPLSVSEDYESLWYIVKDRLAEDNDSLVIWLDSLLMECEASEHGLRYLCRLVTGFPGKESLYSKSDRELSYRFRYDFAEWFAIRFVELLFEQAGKTRIRQIRKEIAAEWLVVEQLPISPLYEPVLARLLSFAFGVLLPLTIDKQPKAVASIAKEVRQNIPRPSSKTTANTSKPAVKPQALSAICNAPFTANDIRDLLIELRVLDQTTGYWHLGALTSKAAKPLSAFPAAYRALVEAKHVDRLDAPVWSKLFQEEFKVKFSVRLANYAWGSASSEFDRYYNEARRWLSKWSK